MKILSKLIILLTFTFCIFSTESNKLFKAIQLQKKYAIKNLNKAIELIDNHEYKELNTILNQTLNTIENHQFNRALLIIKKAETDNRYLVNYLIVIKKILNNINKLLENAFSNACPQEQKYPEVLEKIILDYVQPYNYEVIEVFNFFDIQTIKEFILTPTNPPKFFGINQRNNAVIKIENNSKNSKFIYFAKTLKNLTLSPDKSGVLIGFTDDYYYPKSPLETTWTKYKIYDEGFNIKIFDTDGQLLKIFVNCNTPKLNSTQTLLAIFHCGNIEIWAVPDKTMSQDVYTNSWKLLNIIQHEDGTYPFIWSSDGNMLATADNENKQIKIWSRTF